MIGSLRGHVIDRHGNEVLIEVGGVGYRVVVTPQTLAAISGVETEVFLYTHHHLREDAALLYGFSTLDERTVFESLIATHGVGPALGLAILSTHVPQELRRIVVHEDAAALCQVPGIGKKTAARLLIELKNKLGSPDDIDISDGGAAASPGAINGASTALADAQAALAGLGFGPDEISTSLKGADSEAGADELIRFALQQLATR